MHATKDTSGPNLADLVDNLLSSDHAKAVSSHPDFPVAVASLREDLTKRLQEVLGKGTGVKKGTDSSKVERAADEQTKSEPTTTTSTDTPEFQKQSTSEIMSKALRAEKATDLAKKAHPTATGVELQQYIDENYQLLK